MRSPLLRWIRLALMLTLCCISFGPVRSASGQPAWADDGWAALGPLGEAPSAVGVSPEWPGDPFLFVTLPGGIRDDGPERPVRLARSRDGGRTWELAGEFAEGRTSSPSSVSVSGANDAGERVIFMAVESEAASGGSRVLRSTDDGDTWTVLTPAWGLHRVPLLSPSFSQDGLAVDLLGPALQRTDDGGASWSVAAPPSGQQFGVVTFAPAPSGQLFGSMISVPFLSVTSDRIAERSDDHEQSLGVVVSTDGGATWTPTSGQPEIDGVPFRHVQDVTVSPTFAQDRTLFAYAWGPRERRRFSGGPFVVVASALFRSQDAGATWKSVGMYTPLEAESWFRTSVSIVPSHRFPDDRTLLAVLQSGAHTPASNGCEVQRSTDGGETWQTVIGRGQYEACTRLAFGGTEKGSIAWVAKGNPLRLMRSEDGGLTWRTAGPPVGLAPGGRAGLDAVLPDGTGFLARPGGVWAYGPGAVATEGRLPCPAEVVLGFARAYPDDLTGRAYLGCPIGPEQSVRVRVMRRDDGRRGLWLENDTTWWYELWVSDGGVGQAQRRDKGTEPWAREQAFTVDGRVQYFDRGTMVWLPGEDGTATVHTLFGTWWRETPDRPSIPLGVPHVPDISRELLRHRLKVSRARGHAPQFSRAG